MAKGVKISFDIFNYCIRVFGFPKRCLYVSGIGWNDRRAANINHYFLERMTSIDFFKSNQNFNHFNPKLSAEQILNGTGKNGYVRIDSQSMGFSFFIVLKEWKPMTSRFTTIVVVLVFLLHFLSGKTKSILFTKTNP